MGGGGDMGGCWMLDMGMVGWMLDMGMLVTWGVGDMGMVGWMFGH